MWLASRREATTRSSSMTDPPQVDVPVQYTTEQIEAAVALRENGFGKDVPTPSKSIKSPDPSPEISAPPSSVGWPQGLIYD